jgi:hypothetical protein
MNANYQQRDNVEDLIQQNGNGQRRNNTPNVPTKRKKAKRTKRKKAGSMSVNFTLFLIIVGIWSLYIVWDAFTKPLPSESGKIATTAKK